MTTEQRLKKLEKELAASRKELATLRTEVSTEKLTIVDKKGKMRARLSVEGDVTQLVLTNEKDNAFIQLDVHKDDSCLFVHSKKGAHGFQLFAFDNGPEMLGIKDRNPSIMLDIDNEGNPGLALFSKNLNLAVLQATDEQADLTLYGKNRKPQAVLAAGNEAGLTLNRKNGKRCASLSVAKNKPELKIVGTNGKVRWSAP